MPEPQSYQDILDSRHRPGRDFRVVTGNLGCLAHCLLVAPHGGGIEPGTSEILRAVANLGTWAWYAFEGCLQRGNKPAFHIASTRFDEPTLLTLLGRTQFVISFHGADNTGSAVVYVGGKYPEGRQNLLECINAQVQHHGIAAMDAATACDIGDIGGFDSGNITNRGILGQGVQLEFSREARRLLFRNLTQSGRRHPNERLGALAMSINKALAQLCEG